MEKLYKEREVVSIGRKMDALVSTLQSINGACKDSPAFEDPDALAALAKLNVEILEEMYDVLYG